MISVILYGRNDNHGFNYSKRVAISINCLASTLSDKNDEILFADCCSPENLPTLIESIYDTLTPRAKQIIKVIRIRKEDIAITDSKHFEALARNTLINCSHSDNRWILSTNPDMILVPKEEKSNLSELVKNLEDGFYLLPRFSIPENIWNTYFDRQSPEKIASFLRENSQALHLETVVEKRSLIMFDNPGDFQLMLREDILALNGFEEKMTSSWHIDANLCKRMEIFGRRAKSLEHILKGFHCNHHLGKRRLSQGSEQNSWKRFVVDVKKYKATNTSLGLNHKTLEEVVFNQSYKENLKESLSNFLEKIHTRVLSTETFHTLRYEPQSALCYVFDRIKNSSKKTSIFYVGLNADIADSLDKFLKLNSLNPSVKISSLRILKSIHFKDCKDSDFFIFDFGISKHSSDERLIFDHETKDTLYFFNKLVKMLVRAKKSPTFIGLNVLHTDFKILFCRHIQIENADHASSIIVGSLHKKPLPFEDGLLLTAQYLFTKYFFKYCPRLRLILKKFKASKYLFRSIQS